MTTYPYYEKDYFHRRCGRVATAYQQSEDFTSFKPGGTTTCPCCGHGIPDEEFNWCSNPRRIESKEQKIREILGI